MTVYGFKARYYTRQAWIHLGKAREAKRNLRHAPEGVVRIIQGVIRDQAFFARQSMRCATIYRRIEGRL